jgi:hypothetical protein
MSAYGNTGHTSADGIPGTSIISRRPQDITSMVTFRDSRRSRDALLIRRFARPDGRQGWSSKAGENECSVMSRPLRPRAQDR